MTFSLTHPNAVASTDPDVRYTPAHAVTSLLGVLPPNHVATIIDPAAGRGHIVRCLIDAGYDRARIGAVEIREECRADLAETGIGSVVIGDWFVEGQRFVGSAGLSIISNPPYSVGAKFVGCCLDLSPTYCAMLLRCNTLGSATWAPLWREHPPTALLPLIRRPAFATDSADCRTKDAAEYLWVVWERGQPPMVIVPC
jgi:hypothetical protein